MTAAPTSSVPFSFPRRLGGSSTSRIKLDGGKYLTAGSVQNGHAYKTSITIDIVTTQNIDAPEYNGKNLITVIWTQWQHVWKMQNDDVHGHTLRAKQAIERSAITRELTTIYDNRHHMERPVQQLLHTDVMTHLQRPTWVTRNWITMNTPLIRDSLRRVREQSRQGVRTIQSYFRPVHVPADV